MSLKEIGETFHLNLFAIIEKIRVTLRDASMFIKFNEKESGHVTYGDNTKGKIVGEGIVRNPSTITIENILLVKGLKHNFLSITQSCDKGYYVVFDMLSCVIEHKSSNDLVFKGYRIKNVYMLDLYDVSMYGIKCLVSKS